MSYLQALEPLQDTVAATWINALEGYDHQENIRLPQGEINTPDKLFKIIEHTCGETLTTTQ